jgi:excisionase family DNA binding protein
VTRNRPVIYRTAKQEYVTPAAFGQHFGVSYMTINRLIHGGEIHAIRVGRSIRIPVSELARFAADSDLIGGAA